MELFSIICGTCAAKLKVRQVNAIGQKLGCPKCGAMLKVQPPEGWTPPAEIAEQVANRLKTTQEPSREFDFDNIEEIIAAADKTDAQQQSAKKLANQKRTSSPPTPLDHLPKPQTKPQTKLRPKDAGAQRPGDDKGQRNQPILPTADWTSESSRKRRKLLIIGASVVGGLILSAALLMAYFANQTPAVVKNDSEIEKTKELENAEKTEDQGGKEAENTNDSQDENKLGKTEATPATESQPKIIDPDDPTNDLVTTTPEKTPDPSPTGVNSTPPVIGSEPPEIEASNPDDENTTAPPEVLLPENPMSLDKKPELTSPTDSLTNQDILSGLFPDAPELGPLEALLESTDTSMLEFGDIAAGAATDSFGIPKYFIDYPEPMTIDFDRRLGVEIDRLRFEDKKLLDILGELSMMSGIPIAIDADSLSRAKFPLDTKTSAEFQETNFGNAIDETLKPLMLVSKTNATLGVIIVEAVGDEIPVDEPYLIPPLGEPETEKKTEFIKLIPQLIAPGNWPEDPSPAFNHNGTSVTIKTTPAVHAQIRTLIDKLAAVAQLNQDAKAQDAVETLKTKTELIEDALLQAVSQKPTLRMELIPYLARIREQTGITILFDWVATTKSGWNPATTVPGNMIEPDLKSLLRELAHSMKLAIRYVDPTTIELTSVEMAGAKTDVEVYPCKAILAKGISSDELQEFVFDNILSADIRQSPNVRIYYQPELQCFVVVAPQWLQQKVTSVIRRLAGEK